MLFGHFDCYLQSFGPKSIFYNCVDDRKWTVCTYICVYVCMYVHMYRCTYADTYILIARKLLKLFHTVLALAERAANNEGMLTSDICSSKEDSVSLN